MKTHCTHGHEMTPENTYEYNGRHYCKQCRNKHSNKWKQKNVPRSSASTAVRRQNIKIEVMTHYSNGKPRCVCCGNVYIHHLTVDHIGGGGNEHRRKGEKGGTFLYQWLRSQGFPEGYQIMCFNCNEAKGKLGQCGCQARKDDSLG